MSGLSPAPPSPSAPASSLLRHPDFVRLWTAETISQLGTQVSALAIPFVAIDILEASTFQVALLNVVVFLPFLLIGLPAGVWVDRLRRRPVMIAGDLGRAAALATIPLAFVAGVLTIVQLYIVGFVVGVLTVFFDVAYQSYLPSVVARDHRRLDRRARLARRAPVPHRDPHAALPRDVQGALVARVRVADHAHPRVAGQHALQLLGGEVGAVRHHHHPGVLAVPDTGAAAVVDAHPGRSGGRVHERIEERPVGDRVGPVGHGLRLAVGRGDAP
jgi:hypothetical protein